MDILGLGYRLMVGTCEYNKPSDSIEGSDILTRWATISSTRRNLLHMSLVIPYNVWVLLCEIMIY